MRRGMALVFWPWVALLGLFQSHGLGSNTFYVSGTNMAFSTLPSGSSQKRNRYTQPIFVEHVHSRQWIRAKHYAIPGEHKLAFVSKQEMKQVPDNNAVDTGGRGPNPCGWRIYGRKWRYGPRILGGFNIGATTRLGYGGRG